MRPERMMTMKTRALSFLVGTALIAGLSPLAAAQTTTSTSSSTSTTSTTAAPTTCDDTVPGSLAAVRCRLDILKAEITGEALLGSYQSKLSGTLARAIPLAQQAADACGKGDTKTASRRMKQTESLLKKMSHRLSSLSAPKNIDGTV